MISPVRNEGAHIGRVVRAMAEQELTPARWIVVEDDSDDDTYAQLGSLERDVTFLEVRRAPGGGPASRETRDRLSLAQEARNFNVALATVELEEFTHVMKLDGDIELPREYLRVLMERFAKDASLGIAGGGAGGADGGRGAAVDRDPRTPCARRSEVLVA